MCKCSVGVLVQPEIQVTLTGRAGYTVFTDSPPSTRCFTNFMLQAWTWGSLFLFLRKQSGFPQGRLSKARAKLLFSYKVSVS